jgi:hypothetical protein
MFEALSFSDVGATGLVTIVVVLILLGRLVPRRHLEDVREDAAHWRKAAELTEAARAEEAAQTRQLLEASDMHTRLLESIRDAADRRDPP